MKRITILLLVLCLSFNLFATKTDNSVILSSKINPGTGVHEVPHDVPSIGDAENTFYFYFLPQSSDHVLEKNSIVLNGESPHKAGSVLIDMFYCGSEGVLSNSLAGKHKISIKATPWINTLNKNIYNDISVSAEGIDDEIVLTNISREVDLDKAYIDVKVLSNKTINYKKVGTYSLTWRDKDIAAGEYVATITISIDVI